MELGNMVNGISRGTFEIPRGEGWEEELIRLFDEVEPGRDLSWRDYGCNFENEFFWIKKYDWRECDDFECNEKCRRNECELTKDNFYFKKNGFGLKWYKYPLRDSFKSHDITLEKFQEIIDICIKSIRRTKWEKNG